MLENETIKNLSRVFMEIIENGDIISAIRAKPGFRIYDAQWIKETLLYIVEEGTISLSDRMMRDTVQDVGIDNKNPDNLSNQNAAYGTEHETEHENAEKIINHQKSDFPLIPETCYTHHNKKQGNKRAVAYVDTVRDVVVVIAGSWIASEWTGIEENPTYKGDWEEVRTNDNWCGKRADGMCVLLVDIIFDSAARAASVVHGASRSSSAWVDRNGKELPPRTLTTSKNKFGLGKGTVMSAYDHPIGVAWLKENGRFSKKTEEQNIPNEDLSADEGVLHSVEKNTNTLKKQSTDPDKGKLDKTSKLPSSLLHGSILSGLGDSTKPTVPATFVFAKESNMSEKRISGTLSLSDDFTKHNRKERRKIDSKSKKNIDKPAHDNSVFAKAMFAKEYWTKG